MNKKKARASNASARRRDAAIERPVRDWPLAVVGLLGMVLCGFLAYSAWSSAALPYCNAGSGCDLVQGSRWAVLLGIPIAAWGFLTYAVLAGAAIGPMAAATRWRVATLVATIGVAVSVYLTGVALLTLAATCAYCLASLALIVAALALTWRRSTIASKLLWRLGSLATAILVVGALHLHYAGQFDPTAGPEDPYLRNLASHLERRGVKFYGAYWCPHCQQQKALFAAAARRLPYVECSPHGPQAPQATACLAENVKNYPTWVADGWRYERILSVAELAKLSGFAPPAQ